MKICGDEVTFDCTGRTRYANNGIIGLSPRLFVSEGYDGGFDSYEDDLTPEERRELGLYMSNRWLDYIDMNPETREDG